MNTRIGYGYDVHALAAGDGLMLGGIKIPSTLKSVGHSDADVLIHAICDALLGAANLGDIGQHFPDNDSKFKGIDSTILLKEVMDLIRGKGYLLGNIDSVICLEKPKVLPHVPAIRERLAEVMHTDPDNISIKATTSEKMGFVGRQEGISATAIALIYKV